MGRGGGDSGAFVEGYAGVWGGEVAVAAAARRVWRWGGGMFG